MNSKKPLRVLHVVDALSMGGVETWILSLARFWRDKNQGWRIVSDVVVLGGAPALFDDEIRELGGRVHYLKFGRERIFRFRAEFRALLKTITYDVIHDHQGLLSGWHFLLAGRFRPRVRIAHLHNPTFDITSRSPSRRLVAYIGRALTGHLATHLLSTSTQLRREYGFDRSQFGQLPQATLHCGFATSRFFGASADVGRSVRQEFGWPPDAKIVLCAGRLDDSPDFGHPLNHKNTGFAVSVAIDACSRRRDLRFIFAGAYSAALPGLEARVAKSGLSDSIRFVGVRLDIERLMLAGDALLFPSQAEGLGMVAVDAQAAGLPVLASDTIPRECVVVTGLVTFKDLNDGVGPWSDSLQALVDSAPDRHAANKIVAGSRYSIDRSAQWLERIYSESRRFRVLQVIDSLGVGGAETWLVELAQHWHSGAFDGPQVDFVALSGRHSVFDEEVAAAGSHVFYLPFSKNALGGFLLRFRRLLRTRRYDVLHDHQGAFAGWHFLAGIGHLPRVRLAHLHNTTLDILNRSLPRRVVAGVGFMLVSIFANRLLFTSQSLLNEATLMMSPIRGVPKQVLHCGFDPERFNRSPPSDHASLCQEFGIERGSIIVLVAGRIDPSADMESELNLKNSAFATEVAIAAVRREPKLYVIFAGALSPAVSALQDRVAKTGHANRIRFVGVRLDIERLVAGANALLFPSRAEGLGMIAVEAQAAGVPVLASTGVPREASVVPGLMRFMAVTEGAENWSKCLLEMTGTHHDIQFAQEKVRHSPYTIENSAIELMKVYRTSKAHA